MLLFVVAAVVVTAVSGAAVVVAAVVVTAVSGAAVVVPETGPAVNAFLKIEMGLKS